MKRTLRGAQRRGGRRRLRSELRGPRQPPRAGEQPERVSGALGRAGHRGSEVLRTLGPCGVGPPLFGSCRWGCQFCGLGWSPLCQLTSPPSFPCCPFCKVQKSPILQALHTRPRSARRPLLPPAHALRRLLPARGAGQSPPPPSAAPPAAAARPCPPPGGHVTPRPRWGATETCWDGPRAPGRCPGRGRHGAEVGLRAARRAVRAGR